MPAPRGADAAEPTCSACTSTRAVPLAGAPRCPPPGMCDAASQPHTSLKHTARWAPMASGLCDSFGVPLLAYWRPTVRPVVAALARGRWYRPRPPADPRVNSSEERADASRPVTLEDTMIDAAAIVAGLGGAENVIEIEPCATRLRTEVRDASLVDETALKRAGAIAVMSTGVAVQVIVGPEADTVASDIEELLE